MNKLLTEYNNGFPLLLDDLRFIDDIYRSGIESILKAFANNTDCIVFGCEKTYDGNTLSISAGAIWHDNELFAFAGGTQTNPSNDYYFKVIEVDESFRMFGDGTTSNPVHRLRYVTFNAGTLAGSISVNIPKLKDVFIGVNGEWEDVTLDSQVTGSMKIRKLANGLIELKGSFNALNSSTGIIGTIPNKYVPSASIALPVSVQNSSGVRKTMNLNVTTYLNRLTILEDVGVSNNFDLFYSLE